MEELDVKAEMMHRKQQSWTSTKAGWSLHQLLFEGKIPWSFTPSSLPFFLGSVQVEAQALMLKGKALNVTPDYSPEAEVLLSKAVKLEPELVEAWNQLGEVYWKKGDIAAAHTCFSGALTHVSFPFPLVVGK